MRNNMYNCPNCGAPITGNICEYCGTVFKNNDEVYIKQKIEQLQQQRQALKIQLVIDKMKKQMLQTYCNSGLVIKKY